MRVIKKPPYWVNLDPLVDVKSLLELHSYLCRAVAISPKVLGFGGRVLPKSAAELADPFGGIGAHEEDIYEPFRNIGNAQHLLESLPDDHPAKIDTRDMTTV